MTKFIISVIIILFGTVRLSLGSDSLNYMTYDDLALSEHLKDRLSDNLEYITPLNLAFSLCEFLDLIRNDSFKVKWETSVRNYYNLFNDSLSYFLIEDEIAFLKKTIEMNESNFGAYESEVSFVRKHCYTSNSPKVPSNPLSLLSKYLASDNKRGLSVILMNCLVLNGNEFVKRVEADRDLTLAFEAWLKDMENFEFVATESINYNSEIISRKRKFILDIYWNASSPLMAKTLEVIRGAKIRTID